MLALILIHKALSEALPPPRHQSKAKQGTKSAQAVTTINVSHITRPCQVLLNGYYHFSKKFRGWG
jgi:hypothetical protein